MNFSNLISLNRCLKCLSNKCKCSLQFTSIVNTQSKYIIIDRPMIKSKSHKESANMCTNCLSNDCNCKVSLTKCFSNNCNCNLHGGTGTMSQRIGYSLPRQPRAKAPELTNIIDNELLIKYGYSLNDSREQRQKSLIKAFNFISHNKIFDYLNKLKNLQKSNEKIFNKLNIDSKWIETSYLKK